MALRPVTRLILLLISRFVVTMSYSVKEIYYTLQGEGAQAGRAAVFCRFSGCNLWNGKESDRTTAQCWFCDTDFVGNDGPGGGKYQDHEILADTIAGHWPLPATGRNPGQKPMVVFTGGEPLLQLDEPLIEALHHRGFYTALETNGTLAAPPSIDWITVSPKPTQSPLRQFSGSELKLVYPHAITPESLEHLEFSHFFLSPMTSPDPTTTRKNLASAIDYCLAHPKWKLTCQYHKFWGID